MKNKRIENNKNETRSKSSSSESPNVEINEG